MSKPQDLLNSFYNIDNVVTIKITMPAQEWSNLMHAEPRGGRCNFGYVGDRYDWLKATNVTVSGTKFPMAGTFQDVGIIKKSYCGSFSTTKPSFRLDFGKNIPQNEDAIQKLIGTKSLTLNNCTQDSSYIRQPLGYELFRQAGLPYARCNFAKVIVNGTDMGVYINLEPYKKQFLKNLFKGNDKGNLYELEVGEDLDPAIIAAGKISFESGIDDSEKDIKLAAAKMASEGLAGMRQVVDYESFIKLFAMETLLKHWDGYTINSNNTYIYNDVEAVADPTLSDVKLKFIPCGIDQILQEGRNFEIGGKAICARLVRDDAGGKKNLFSAIRTLANTVFSKTSHDTVLKPYIDKMEDLLRTAGVVPTEKINTVRNQIKLVRSGAFQIIGEFPTIPTVLLSRGAGETSHVSNGEFVPPGGPSTGPQEVYHYAGTPAPADYFTVSPSKAGTFKFQNQAYGSWLHADGTTKTPSGKLNVYAVRTDPNEGNNFMVEGSGGLGSDPWKKTGYFRVKSALTGNYVQFSESDLTPGGKKDVCQSANQADAVVLYIF